MKVKDLVGLLQSLDPEKEVLLTGYEGGYYNCDRVRPITVALDWNDRWYYGPHELLDEYLVEQAKLKEIAVKSQESYLLY